MRVFGRGLILAALLCATAPSVAGAAPILNGTGGASCGGIVASASLGHCGLFDILSFADPLSGSFENLEDVALFRFTVSDPSTFSATISQAVNLFDGFLGLFDGDTGSFNSVTYLNATEGDFVRAQGVDLGVPDPILLGETGERTYILALLLGFNGFTQSSTDVRLDSLLAGFSADDTTDPDFAGILHGSCDPEQRACGFSVAVNVESEGAPQAVPEPGTLALVGCGALAAVVRRRSRRRI